MTVKTRSGGLYQAGQYIVCSSNGLGVVVAIEDRIIAGSSRQFYKLFFKKDGLTCFVPVDKVADSGIRKPCTKDIGNRVYAVLASQPKSSRGMWSKRAQEYEAKVCSKSILLCAEALRDLSPRAKDPGRSYSEALIYDNAFYRIVSELSVVLGGTEDFIAENVLASLMKSVNQNAKLPDRAKTNGDFDDDLDEFRSDSYEDEDSESVAA